MNASSGRGLPRLTAGAVVVAVLLIITYITTASRQPTTASSAPDDAGFDREGPESCIAALIAAEKSGDVEAYLDCFTGPLRTKLEDRIAAKTSKQIAAELRRNAADLTGFSTGDLQFSEINSGTVVVTSATLVVQRIFKQHNDRQRVQLQRIDGDWKICRLKPLERVAPAVPYGSPVFPDEQHGRER